jgi:hypothetical protein
MGLKIFSLVEFNSCQINVTFQDVPMWLQVGVLLLAVNLFKDC